MKTKPANKLHPTPDPSGSEPVESQEKIPLPLKSGAVWSLGRILVPIDFSECSLRALDYALALAETFAAKVVLLHVVEPAIYPENYLITPATLDEANQNLLETGRERLAAVRQRVAGLGVPAEALVRMGRAQSEIPDTAKATGSDLIVLGTHCHPGLQPVLLGGTAERVVRHSTCPVLTVRHPSQPPSNPHPNR